MRIKICGNTTLEDALLAATLGADAVGFVFAPGKRTVTAAQLAASTPQLTPTLEKIGVFTTGCFHDILATSRQGGLTGVQLHSAFAPSLLAQLRSALPPSARVIQVLHWFTDIPAADQLDTFAQQAVDVAANATADAVLVDTRTRTATGGTGIPFDWQAAQHALAHLRQPLVLAGGLTPGNVAAAITTLQPWGLDVASGVEASPGHKDPARLAAFLHNARAASADREPTGDSSPGIAIPK